MAKINIIYHCLVNNREYYISYLKIRLLIGYLSRWYLSSIITKFYVPILTIAYLPNLTQNVPNLTGYPNVPKIEQKSKKASVPSLGVNFGCSDLRDDIVVA